VTTEHEHELKKAKGMPFGAFFLSTFAQLAMALIIFWLFFPDAFAHEMSRPWHVVMWTALIGIPLSLFEYLYHRYLLHSAVLPFLGSMHRAHSHHHGLTNVKAPVTPNEPATLVPVENEYPIEHEHQEESMMFPAYAATIFFVIFLLLIGLPLKLIFPAAPIVSGTLFCVTLCYGGYEVWHAITHLSFDRFWKPAMKKRGIGKMMRHAYGFHLMHHWRPTCNLAVVGLWGVAVWDYAFGTHRRPENLPVGGGEVRYIDAELKKPRFPIGLLDKAGKKCHKAARTLEQKLKKFFTWRRKPSGSRR
jgi:hypothetical protein